MNTPNKTHDSLGYRLNSPRVKTIEEYLTLEKELATILNKGKDVHFWGGPETGIWVQSQDEMQTYSPWTRSHDAATELIIENDVWAAPYPVEHSKCYEGKFFYGDRFHAVYVPYDEHQSKAAAYRYTILLTTVAKLRRIRASI